MLRPAASLEAPFPFVFQRQSLPAGLAQQTESVATDWLQFGYSLATVVLGAKNKIACTVWPVCTREQARRGKLADLHARAGLRWKAHQTVAKL